MPTSDPNRPALPRIGLTMGDPSGVGPEVIAAVWADPRVWQVCEPVVFGGTKVLREAAKLRRFEGKTEQASSLLDALDKTDPTRLMCVGEDTPTLDGFEPGVVDAKTGEAAFQAVTEATRLALAEQIDAIVTAPLSKAGLHAAGHDYPGHTELLAEMCGVDDFAMMLYLPPALAPETRAGIGVVHVTLHTSLRNAIDTLSIDGIAAKCQLAHDAAIAYGVPEPRIGVAALNPHAGEGGLFGDEESRLIAPAVEIARQQGINASGPHPIDTLMGRAVAGEFDTVVAMYHDQGHIALKLLGMHGAVNITLGLPIVRTSVAHGTAPDKAWKGTAETSGMIAAIQSAAALAVGRR